MCVLPFDLGTSMTHTTYNRVSKGPSVYVGTGLLFNGRNSLLLILVTTKMLETFYSKVLLKTLSLINIFNSVFIFMFG